MRSRTKEPIARVPEDVRQASIQTAARRLEEIRNQRRLTQKDLAALVGVDEGSIRNWLSAKHPMPAWVLYYLEGRVQPGLDERVAALERAVAAVEARRARLEARTVAMVDVLVSVLKDLKAKAGESDAGPADVLSMLRDINIAALRDIERRENADTAI